MAYRLAKLSTNDAKELFTFEKENKQFFEKTVPPRPASYYVFDEFRQILTSLLEEQTAEKSSFYLIRNEANEIIGRMNIVDIDWQEKTGDIGYRIGEKYIGKGVATQALQLLQQQIEGINQLCAKTTKNNIGSQKVLERNGFNQQNEEGQFVYYQWVKE